MRTGIRFNQSILDSSLGESGDMGYSDESGTGLRFGGGLGLLQKGPVAEGDGFKAGGGGDSSGLRLGKFFHAANV